MIIKGIISEDFINYKKPCMYVSFPKCTFKCDKENGCQLCQNSSLAHQPDIQISAADLVKKYYVDNPITKAVLCCGLEPLDTFSDLLEFVEEFREVSSDDIVIFTGYTEEECSDKVDQLKQYPNIIVKFGRFRPNQQAHFDELLGVKLASDNQYAKQIS